MDEDVYDILADDLDEAWEIVLEAFIEAGIPIEEEKH